jgi:mono/diheme cytochrome c family protein
MSCTLQDRRSKRLGAVLAFLAAGMMSPPTWAEGDAANGEALADRWCASCHVISEAAAAGMEGLVAPMFMELELEEASALKAAIAPPHPSMPGFADFTEQDYEDVLAYIHSVADE